MADTPTVKQDLHRAEIILGHVEKLTPATRRWLISALEARYAEEAAVPIGRPSPLKKGRAQQVIR